ncbi:sucrose nonfermenting 4-like protein isoform X2 [Punica granatum]|uniref:Sucrose nonfermenting 4-like protein isoform X2 n=1 Tax=Punica granatum TaxID=22663 RepID=A0A6P8BZW2_PUNGR|nr:sucrose nonfermenting 4-like protein isoform X2 [Punica granatum]
MESAVRESSGGVSPVLIPMLFVWPCGGTSVFMSGSFNRWSQLLPMSPVEGCPMVFQTICSIPPGCHQYKFFVDGEWRHDEHQPYMTSEFGIVNTIFLTSERNSFSGVPAPNVPPPPMDVDNNEASVHLPQVSGSTFTEAAGTILEADIIASRLRVSAFLSAHTAYELLPESGKVVALDINLPVKQAFHILYEQLTNRGSNLAEEELETHTISAWKEGKAYLKRQVDEQGRAFSKPLVHVGPDDNLKDVALKILQNNVASVPVLHSPSNDGSFQQLLHMASLSGILKCICRYFRSCSSSLPVLQLPICTIPIGTWVPKIGESNRRPLAMMRPNASLSSALNLLIEAQVSSIPVVDENDSLLDIYSRSDITALAKDKSYTRISLNEMTVHQALQLGQDSYCSFELSRRCQMCLKSDSLHKVIERLANPGVRRLIVVEAGSKRVEGIISLSDVFKFLLS